MKRKLVAVLLVLCLLVVTSVPSCDSKGDPAGPGIFIATVILLGLTVGGWFQDDHDEGFPPQTYDLLPYPRGEFHGSIQGPAERDWYRTEVMRAGETITIWAESDYGVRAVLVDEDGRYYPSDNFEPGSNFKIQVQANERMTYFLQVYSVTQYGKGPYTIRWQYGW